MYLKSFLALIIFVILITGCLLNDNSKSSEKLNKLLVFTDNNTSNTQSIFPGPWVYPPPDTGK
ncbi:MAG TPA: hypothetical protein PKW76_16955 [bacterium]|nr:hypothetical protein [bacterium]HPG47360.1 hypothetical protein [bacterium]HPM96712.1 hypothetical protein [bacterium]